MRARIGGRVTLLSLELVESRTAKVEPETIRDHFVLVGGRSFPIKQALEVATGIDRSDFTTHQARSLFRRLGLETGRASSAVGESTVPYGASHKADVSEEALRPFRGRWVALRSGHVVAASGSAPGLIKALRKRGERADRMLRVMSADEPDVEIPGADR